MIVLGPKEGLDLLGLDIEIVVVLVEDGHHDEHCVSEDDEGTGNREKTTEYTRLSTLALVVQFSVILAHRHEL